MSEMGHVSGGGDSCPSGDSGGNDYGGISDTTSVGEEIINIYEGLVAATSHIIERVANAL
jgi:molybdenum-dependent DNA-binding transcriptional regulator ModE